MVHPRRVLIVTETFPPEVNGVARTVAGYRTGLEALGHEVHVLRPRQPSDGVMPDDRRTHLCAGVRLPRYRALRFGVPRPGAVGELLKRTGAEVVYVATEGPLGAAAVGAARRAGIPVVAGFHTNFHQFVRHYGAGILAAPAYAYLRRFHNKANATLASTPALRDALLATGFRAVAWCPRGVDTQLFSAARRDPALRATWGADDDTPVVIHVGRMAAEKNIALAMDAFAVYRSVRHDARMVFVGDGPHRATVERRAPEAVFCGVQTGERLAAHYASADILLFPSLTETFGNITLEGMASGLALVAFDYAAAGEHVTDGWNGLLAPFGDPDAFLERVRRLALNRPLAERLRAGARESAADLGLARAHAALSEFLELHIAQAAHHAAA